MEQAANSIQVTVYTPGGLRAYINFGSLITATELDSKVAELGFLATAPGVEPGEVTEPILYVCRYDHTDTKTGKQIPHIAFYSESEWLTKRWLHVYLDKPEDVEAFETATGLTVATMPVWMGETHPERNNPKAQKFVVRLAKAIRIARDTYTNKEGETRHKLKRYVDTIGKPQATATPGSGQQAGDTGNTTTGTTDDLPPNTINFNPPKNDIHLQQRRVSVLNGVKQHFNGDMTAMMKYADSIEVDWNKKSADIIVDILDALDKAKQAANS